VFEKVRAEFVLPETEVAEQACTGICLKRQQHAAIEKATNPMDSLSRRQVLGAGGVLGSAAA
jgi:hypothetical protein